MTKKIAIACCGSWGDVAPMLGLADHLQRVQGHEVLFLCPPESVKRVSELGFKALPLGESVRGQLQGSNMRSLKMSLGFLWFLHRQIRIQLRTAEALLQGCDLVLGSSFVWGVALVAEKMKIPYRFSTYCPQTFETSEHPPMVWKWNVKGKIFRRLLWWGFYLGQDLLSLPQINFWRLSQGLPWAGSSQRVLHGSAPVLFCDPVWVSETFKKERPDVTLLPRFRYQPSKRDALSEGLQAFLDRGGPLIFIGMGSMPSPYPDRIVQNIARIAQNNQWRIILDSGWAGFSGPNTDWLWITQGYVNHSILFDAVDVIVHHGGAGTLHEAWYAGKPQVVIPHVMDQFYWARRIVEQHRGLQLDTRALLNKKLAEAIASCLSLPKAKMAVPQPPEFNLFL